MTVPENEFEDRPELVKKRARTNMVGNLLKILVVTTLLAMLGILAYDSYNGVQTRKELLDCTAPAGECYQDGVERTAKVVKNLITAGRNDEIATRRVVVLAAYCANVVDKPTVESITKCVQERLEDEQ